jgi:cytosine/adenosine deaminase-related metal-dependent hydrolase
MRFSMGLDMFKIEKLIFVLGFFCLGIFAHRLPESLMQMDQSSLDSSQASEWVVSGYLYSAPRVKSYLHIKDGKIYDIYSERPVLTDLKIIETENWIFPSPMNLHNHLKYNILPLWRGAQSQFFNRYEWRDLTAYQDFVKFNMKAIPAMPKESVCAAVRWAEMKELFSGVSVTQGIGGDVDCARGFGPRNVEVREELVPGRRAVALLDTIEPDFLKPIYHGVIEPIMKEKGLSFGEATALYLKEKKVDEWYEKFRTLPRTIHSALLLTIGSAPTMDPQQKSVEYFESIREILKQHLLDNKIATLEVSKSGKVDVDTKVEELKFWIFGGGRIRDPMIKFASPLSPEEARKNGVDLLSAGIVKIIPSEAKRLSLFEEDIRQKMIRESKDSLALVIHLSEGRRKDFYSQLEYDYLEKTGINLSKNLMIHAVGLSSQQLDEVQKLGQSIVWSPFSNLLLYGETLNIAELRKRNINFAIATDWSLSGSRTIYEELRLARAYLQSSKEVELSSEEFFESVTINAAKALGVDDRFGSLKKGYAADLVLAERKSQNPFDDFVNLNEKQISLVSVEGRVQFGSTELLANLIDSKVTSENISVCGASKTYFWGPGAPADKKMDLRSYAKTKEVLQGFFQDYRKLIEGNPKEAKNVKNLAKLDPMFTCEDPEYEKFVGQFISEIWPKNLADREVLRKGLKPNFNPME